MQRDTVFSVSQINEYIKMTLESNPVLKGLWLRGEISNFKSNYASGHMYFSLKDESSSIRAVMFRGSAARLRFRPESGMTVIVHGKISTYTVSGDYQIIIDDMQPDGAGALALAFEQLKKRLDAEGLFAAERKLPIPKFPKSVGVITSASGAALHDIINVSGRRCPSTEIIIYPAYVQGDLAPKSLCSGIRFFNDRDNVDLIIIGRGGGSAEDLWGFNDENLARAIADSHIPVISAVGHETDFTICDFVSDKRAPTPSAAAELAFPDTRELMAALSHLRARADSAVSRKIYLLVGKLDVMSKSIELNSPSGQLKDKLSRLDTVKNRLNIAMTDRFDRVENRFKLACATLEGVNPLAILSRGYAVAENSRGEIIGGVENVDNGEVIKVRLSDGILVAQVIEKEKISERNIDNGN